MENQTEVINPKKHLPPDFQSESSIIVHPYDFPKENQAVLPTWALLLVLIVSFFVLKFFIYIVDEKRHGK
jgi:hypothetical protein